MVPATSQCFSRRESREFPARDEASTIAGKRVLLAEDDPNARRIVATALQSFGLDVIETDDGGRMLVAVTAHYKDGLTPDDLDLIVTDMYMPVVDGLEVCRVLRAAHWKTPMILVTESDAPEIYAAAARLGVVVLPKPLDLDLFECAVRELLAPLRSAMASSLNVLPTSLSTAIRPPCASTIIRAM